MADPIFRRKWQLVLLAGSVSLTACGGGGAGGSTSGGLFQSITFDYPGGSTLAAGPVTLHATASSGLPVSFRSQTPSSCTVSGDQLTLVSAAECLVVASQPGGKSADGRTWAAADETSQLFNVLKHSQQVTFTPPDYVLSSNTSSVPLSASADSGLPVTFSSDTPDVCAISGSTLQIKAKGSCAVTASQAGDGTYAAQSTQRFIAVDPLIVEDGFAPLAAGDNGSGTSNSMATKQGGGVKVNPWGSPLNAGWEWCTDTSGNWCYRTVSADGSSLTSGLDIPDSNYTPGGWQYSFNRVDIFSPGLNAFNGSGDTTGGLQVTTEKSLVFTIGVNGSLYRAGKPIMVHLDLGKSNNGCNVELSAQLWPKAAGLVSYSIPLGDFAVTNNCGLAGVTQASLDNDVRKVPSPWPTAATPDAATQYQAALDTFKDARTAATNLLKTSQIVRTRFWLDDVNVSVKPTANDIPAPTAAELKLYSSRMTIKGAITLQ